MSCIIHKWKYDLSWRGWQFRTCKKCGIHQELVNYSAGSEWQQRGCDEYADLLMKATDVVKRRKNILMGKNPDCKYHKSVGHVIE